MMKNATVKMAVKSKEKMPTAAMPSAGKGRVPVVPQGYGNGGTVYPAQGMKNGGKAMVGDEAKSRRNAMNQRMMAAGKSARKK